MQLLHVCFYKGKKIKWEFFLEIFIEFKLDWNYRWDTFGYPQFVTKLKMNTLITRDFSVIQLTYIPVRTPRFDLKICESATTSVLIHSACNAIIQWQN